MKEENAVNIMAIVTLIASKSAHQVSMFGDLSIYRLEDGRYAVNHTYDIKKKDGTKTHKTHERIFENPFEAARYFEKYRKRKQMGFEYEIPRNNSRLRTIRKNSKNTSLQIPKNKPNRNHNPNQ